MLFFDALDYFTEEVTRDEVDELAVRGVLFLREYGKLEDTLKDARVKLSLRAVWSKYLIADNSAWKTIDDDLKSNRIAKFSFLSCFMESARHIDRMLGESQPSHARSVCVMLANPWRHNPRNFKMTGWQTRSYEKEKGLSFLLNAFA